MKTSNLALSMVLVSAIAATAFAAEFRAETDRDEIALDESVNLKLVVQSDGNVPAEEPNFEAPDFELINQFTSQFVQSTYDNGNFSAKFTRTFTFILRPKKQGKLTFANFRVKVADETLRAPNITITVGAGGAATPPGYGYGGGGVGLRGAMKETRSSPLFVRAEVDKNQAFKGEQVIVSYYLYSRLAAFNASADKFPELPGFLKEELEMPIVQSQGRLGQETVTYDGRVYRRSLLARFAAYPLKEGKLSIDPMALKAQYYDQQSAGEGEPEDDLFSQFFHQMTPRQTEIRSQPVPIEVSPLPTTGRPADFSGAVGDFSVMSAVDRYEAKAGQPISLTLKVEGRGNLSNLEAPKIVLPPGVDLYESRAQTRGGKGGSAEKVFEYLLIPRQAGEYDLPALEVPFFDPKKKSYVRKGSLPIHIKVVPGEAGDPLSPPPSALTDAAREVPSPEKPFLPKLSTTLDSLGAAARGDGPLWSRAKTGVFATIGILLAAFVAWVGITLWRRRGEGEASRNRFRLGARDWEKWRKTAVGARTLPFGDVLELYERGASRIYDALEERYPSASRALSRRELRDLLVEELKMPENSWSRISALLEFTEMVRFASSAGALSEDRARGELAKWFEDAEAAEKELFAQK